MGAGQSWLKLSYLLEVMQEQGIGSLLENMGYEEDAETQLVRAAIKYSFPALDEDPGQLPGQLLARLLHETSPKIQALLSECAAYQRNRLVPLTQGLLHPRYPELMVLKGHDDFVGGLALMPDGRHLLSCSEDGSIVLWDLFRSMPIKRIEGHGSPVNVIHLTKDGRFLFAGDDKSEIWMWETQDWKVVRRFRGHEGYIRDLVLTPDEDSMISVDASGMMCCWQTATGTLVRKLRAHLRWCNAIAISPDGTILATSSTDNVLRLWRRATLAPLGDLCNFEQNYIEDFEELGRSGLVMSHVNTSGVGHKTFPHSIRFSPDGKKLISAADEIIVWDVAQRQQERVFARQGWSCSDFCFSPDGEKLISASNCLQIWDWKQESLDVALVGHTQGIKCLALSANGRTAFTGSDDKSIRVWSLDYLPQAIPPGGHTESVACVCLSPDDTMAVTTANDASVTFWDLETGKVRLQQRCHTSPFIEGAAISSKGSELVTGCGRGELLLWSLPDGACIRRTQTPHPYMIKAVEITPDRSLAVVGGVNESLLLWSLSDGSLDMIEDKEIHVCGMVLSSDSQRAITTAYNADGPGSLESWLLPERKKLYTRNLKRGHGSCIAWLPGEAEVLVGTSEGAVLVWDTEKGRRLHQYDAHRDYVTSLQVWDESRAFSLDSAGQLVEWTFGRKVRFAPYLSSIEGFIDFDICPSKQQMILLRPSKLLLWDVERGESLAQFNGEGGFRLCRFTSDGNRIIIGCAHGRVMILQVR